MPNRSETETEFLQQAVECEVAKYATAYEQGDASSLAVIERQMVEIFGSQVIPPLLRIAGRYRAEQTVLRAALEKKSKVLDSLLAAPRRIVKVLGLVYEEDGSGESIAWAVLQGPPPQAVRFHADVSPHEICEDHPEDPVWVWLVESPDGLVVLGKIEPPPLLHIGIETEMVFEGLVETEGGNNE